MQHNVRIEEQFTDRVISEELLSSCRNHIETLQNLSHLISIDAADTIQVRLNVEMMEWHLRNLAEVLLVRVSVAPPAKPQVSPVSTIAAQSDEGMHFAGAERVLGDLRIPLIFKYHVSGIHRGWPRQLA
jgi:hypothetical protein